MTTVTGGDAGAVSAARRRPGGFFWVAGLLALAVLAAGVWVVWRYTAPVQVAFVADIGDLPFTVEVIPPVVMARPGEVISITYRISNNHLTPISAYGRLTLAPAAAETQMYVFITQCGGLNTFQNNYVDDYDVVFRVEPAGLFGTSQIVVNHIFTRSSPK